MMYFLPSSHAVLIKDTLVRAPTLNAPERSSVGYLSMLVFGSTKLLYGAFTLHAPLNTQKQRVPLNTNSFYSYSHAVASAIWTWADTQILSSSAISHRKNSMALHKNVVEYV